MKKIDWTAESEGALVQRQGPNDCTYSAERVIVGNCPDCRAPLVVFNDHESWPLVACACGWRGDTHDFESVRFERDVPPVLRRFFPSGSVYMARTDGHTVMADSEEQGVAKVVIDE